MLAGYSAVRSTDYVAFRDSLLGILALSFGGGSGLRHYRIFHQFMARSLCGYAQFRDFVGQGKRKPQY